LRYDGTEVPAKREARKIVSLYAEEASTRGREEEAPKKIGDVNGRRPKMTGWKGGDEFTDGK